MYLEKHRERLTYSGDDLPGSEVVNKEDPGSETAHYTPCRRYLSREKLSKEIETGK